MNETTIMAIGLAVLSLASGMLGLGVAFAAVPFLGLFLHDLVHEVQPLSLVLNGVTALFSLFGFAQSRLVTWKPAILLAVVTTFAAPFGSYLAQIVNPKYLWAVYFVAVAYDPTRNEFRLTLTKLAEAGTPVHVCHGVAEDMGKPDEFTGMCFTLEYARDAFARFALEGATVISF